MTLTYCQIEAHLLEGVFVESRGREFIARTIPENDDVIIAETTGLRRLVIPLESVADRAHATDASSDLPDLGALNRLLAQLIVTAGRRG